MAQLPSSHHDLPAVMSFMSHEIRKHVAHVEREIAPCVRSRRRNLAVVREPESEQLRNRLAASLQSRNQSGTAYPAAVNRLGQGDTVRTSESPDPHAA